MPLRAIINGKEFIAPLIEDSEWERLKKDISASKKLIILPCCNQSGFMRISKLGTKHFVHKRNTECSWEPESLQHLKAKSDIAIACKQANYEVSTEVPGPDWRADVMATKGKVKIAFEVQISPQTHEATTERQERYIRDCIRGCWFFSERLGCSLMATESANKDLPLFLLSMEEDKSLYVSLNGKSYSLIDFVESLLCKRIKFCQSLKSRREQTIQIVFYETKCWKCNKRTHAYFLKNPYQSRCGITLFGSETPIWSKGELVFRPEILSVVRDFLKTDRAVSLKMGPIKRRYIKEARGWYLSFGCFWCDSVFGESFRFDESLSIFGHMENATMIFERTVIPNEPIIEEFSHWCFPENSQFCDL